MKSVLIRPNSYYFLILKKFITFQITSQNLRPKTRIATNNSSSNP